MNPSAPQQPNSPSNQPSTKFQFHASGGQLLVEYLKNVFLTVVTLGIYSYWAVVNFRKFFWSNTSIGDQRLSYHGTGMELFIGALKVGLILAGLNILVTIAAAIHIYAGLAFGVTIGLSLLFIIPYGMYSARRYKLSRTAWRGVRFRMDDKATDFAKLFLKESILTGLTLGFWLPIMRNRIYAFKMNHTHWGDLDFRYTGEDKAAFNIWIKGVLLTGITFGIYFLWHLVNVYNYRAQNTWVGGSSQGAAHARISATGGALFWQIIKVEMLTIFTLGMAAPWAMCSMARFAADALTLQGNVNFDAVKAVESEGNATGEALDAAFG